MSFVTTALENTGNKDEEEREATAAKLEVPLPDIEFEEDEDGEKDPTRESISRRLWAVRKIANFLKKEESTLKDMLASCPGVRPGYKNAFIEITPVPVLDTKSESLLEAIRELGVEDLVYTKTLTVKKLRAVAETNEELQKAIEKATISGRRVNSR